MMKVNKINTTNQTVFKHTSGDFYIQAGRYTEPIEKVHKYFLRWDDPWYRKLLYPFEDLKNYIIKLVKKR